MPGGEQASQPAARGHHAPSVIFTHVGPNPALHHFRIMGCSDLACPWSGLLARSSLGILHSAQLEEPKKFRRGDNVSSSLYIYINNECYISIYLFNMLCVYIRCSLQVH